MRLQHRSAIFLSGALWLGVGFMLMFKGINLLMAARSAHTSLPLVNLFIPLTKHSEQAVLCLVVLSLFLGTLKGRTVIAKAARKIIAHIRTLPNPVSLRRLYPLRYYILLGCMMSLGFLRRVTGLSDDIGGVIDLTVGCALIQGALVYFRNMAEKVIGDTASDGK